eukprot:TRINITY_DN17199_c0_g1_i1.p1 TRINITY_DN17199_c0_g1~~TRINITY_DN17199_c0_g1_i1.p1  ORF type:complete len:355 (-),score=52.60 TRINITY_DN17199_c0_g1_i1:396-1460(-)
MAGEESKPLLPTAPTETYQAVENRNNAEARRCFFRHKKVLIILLILFGWAVIIIALVVNFFVVAPAIPTPTGEKVLKMMSLSVWGSPASFGTKDKEERMVAIGDYIRNHTDVDLYLLQELWMRPDHQTIKSALPSDYMMTAVGSLAPALCDGRVAPTFCSGLAVVSKYPLKEVSFTEYSAHGYIFYKDGEYWARKGTGRVRIETAKNYTVDIFLTSTCAFDYNTYYRQIQAAEFADTVSKSTADFVIGAGDFNIDPRTSETTYTSVIKVLKDTRKEYLGQEHWLKDPKMATYGNKANSYSYGASSLVYDYFWHRARHGHSVSVAQFSVPILKTRDGHSFSNHEAIQATFVLAKH